jgi:hypothetical protein
MFPGIPQQSGYNKRLRAAGTLISATITALAKDTPSWHDVLRLVDSTALPCGMSRETVKRSDLAGMPATAIALRIPATSGAFACT